jgi:hypothetical protein
MKKTLLAAAILIVNIASAQYGYRDANRIGIGAGINQFTLNTNNFDTKPGIGWSAGLSVRGNYYNNFSMIYSIQFSENNFEVATRDGLMREDVKFKLPSAQIALLLSYNLVENHLSVDFGPMIQVNGKMKIDEEFENNIVTGTNMTAKQLTDISKFGIFPTVGISGGFTNLRLNVSYQYGLTNMLSNLNDKGYGSSHKGHAGILTGSIIVYL